MKTLLRYKLGRSPLGKLLSKILGIIPDQGKLLSKILGIIPDHLLIPYPAEDLFWVLFQKSTVI